MMAERTRGHDLGGLEWGPRAAGPITGRPPTTLIGGFFDVVIAPSMISPQPIVSPSSPATRTSVRWLPRVQPIPGLSTADLENYVLGLRFLADHGCSLEPYADLFCEQQGGTQEQLTAVLAKMRADAKAVQAAGS